MLALQMLLVLLFAGIATAQVRDGVSIRSTNNDLNIVRRQVISIADMASRVGLSAVVTMTLVCADIRCHPTNEHNSRALSWRMESCVLGGRGSRRASRYPCGHCRGYSPGDRGRTSA